jgi:hypothetical protein
MIPDVLVCIDSSSRSGSWSWTATSRCCSSQSRTSRSGIHADDPEAAVFLVADRAVDVAGGVFGAAPLVVVDCETGSQGKGAAGADSNFPRARLDSDDRAISGGHAGFNRCPL